MKGKSDANGMKEPSPSSSSQYRPLLPKPPFCASKLGTSRNRHPLEKPKRMLNAYNFFFHHERLRLIEEAARTGSSGFRGLAKHVGDMWKLLDQEDKEPYQRLADEDKTRFQREFAEWKMAVKRRGKPMTNKQSDKIPKSKQQPRTVKHAIKTRQVTPPPPPTATLTATQSTLHHHPTKWEMKELADRLGHDGVEAVIRIFLH